jgi:hypothetical protein
MFTQIVYAHSFFRSRILLASEVQGLCLAIMRLKKNSIRKLAGTLKAEESYKIYDSMIADQEARFTLFFAVF